MTLCLMMFVFVKLRIDCVGTEAKMSSKKQDTFFLQKRNGGRPKTMKMWLCGLCCCGNSISGTSKEGIATETWETAE